MEESTHLVPEEQEYWKLYEGLKSVIWVLRILGLNETSNEVKENEYEVVAASEFTGFTVSKGLIMTCAHEFIRRDVSNYDIRGRRLDEVGFCHKLKIHNIEKSWDIAVLTESEGELKDCKLGEFDQDGSLEKGETVMMIGHPKGLMGSCLLGSVAYTCLNDVTLPNDSSTCKDFKSDACDEVQKYRKMGHLFYDGYFTKYGDNGMQILHPNIPIIQFSGLRGSPGTSGSPVFNNRGKIVGMGVMGVDGFDIGVHLSLLQHFLSLPESKLK